MCRFFCPTAVAICIAALFAPALEAQDQLFNDPAMSRVIELRTTEAPPKPTAPPMAQSSRTERTPSPSVQLPDPQKIGFDEIKPGEPTVLEQAPAEHQAAVTDPAQSVRYDYQQPVTQAQQPQFNYASPTVSNQWTSSQQQVVPQFASESQAGNAVSTSIAPQITTRVVSPKAINLNEQASVTIQVKNTSRSTAQNVILSAVIPEHAKVNSSSPQPTSVDGQKLQFMIPQIASGATQELVLQLIPTAKLSMQIGTSIQIQQSHTVDVAVLQPNLKIDVSGPVQSNIGNWSTHTVIVTNIGDGTARNVALNHQLPAEMQQGLETSALTIPELKPRSTQKIQFRSMSTTAGEFDMNFAVSGNHCEARQASHRLKVYQPELQVSASSPELTFVDRDGIYSIQVENKGQVDVTGVVVALATPPGINVTTVSREAKVDPQTGQLTWKFDKIAAAGTESIQMKATATAPGNQICVLQVGSNETVAEKFELITQVQTHADVSINLINQNGPIEVGSRTEFIVNVENRGSRSANGVEVAVELAPSLMPVAESTHQVNELDNTIRFAVMDIPAGEQKQLKFTVAAVAKGEHVVRGVVKINDSNRRLIAEDSVFVFDPDTAKLSESLTPSINRR